MTERVWIDGRGGGMMTERRWNHDKSQQQREIRNQHDNRDKVKQQQR